MSNDHHGLITKPPVTAPLEGPATAAVLSAPYPSHSHGDLEQIHYYRHPDRDQILWVIIKCVCTKPLNP